MSNLLSQASLVMIPSGYKEDVVYSPIPTDGSGDLSFTRASNGTRINSAGLVEVCPWNLLQNSNAFNTAPWSMNVTSGQAGKDGQNNAWLLTKAGASTSDFYNSNVYDGIQTFSIYVKKETNKGFKLYPIGTTTQYATISLETGSVINQSGGIDSIVVSAYSSTWWKISVALNMINSNYYIYVTDGAGTQIASSITIQDAQVNIGLTAKPYFPTTDRLNVPRLTYQNGGGGCPSLLLEKQSTNLLVYSEQFDQWGTNGTTTANAGISPDGTQNADRLNYTSGNIYWLDASINVTNGVSYTYSLYVKPTSVGNQFRFYLDGAFNDSTVITTDSSDWKRYTWTFTASATGSINPHVLLGYGYSSQSILVWGAQLEASSYATSLINTTSASATRVADVCTKSGIGALIGGTSGTVFFDIKTNPVLSSANYKQFCYYVTSGGSQSYLYLDGANKITTNATWGSLFYNTALQPNTRYKVALVFAPNDFALYINGVSVATASSGTPNTNVDIQIGQFNGSEMCEFVFNQYTHFPSRLTNAELSALTTI